MRTWRRLFTTAEAYAAGITESGLRWGTRTGRWRRIRRNVYGEGTEDPTALDQMRAEVLARNGVARATLAGVLHGLDEVRLIRRAPSRNDPPADRIMTVRGMRCANGLQTLIDLAPMLDDDRWEHALESARRKGLVTVAGLEEALPELSRARTPGTARIRRVLALLPEGAPPTGSFLETAVVQLIRTIPEIPDPVRQFAVTDNGRRVAHLDLSWPWPGAFLELDGQQHEGQPQYDAMRETDVVATTGMLCGRFTYADVVHYPQSTLRRLRRLWSQAMSRPLPPSVHPAEFERVQTFVISAKSARSRR